MSLLPTHEESGKKRLDWDAIMRTQEARIFFTGVGCSAAILSWAIMMTRHAGLILATLTTHLTAGRAVGITTALEGGLTRWQAILLGSLIESAVVCFFFSAFCLSYKRLITVRFLSDAMDNVRRSASSQRRRLLRWGIPGLLVFVWFPFFMTGPVVGSVIGFLLGMRPWVVITVVLTGTITAVISWTFILNEVIGWAQAIGEFVPLMLVGMLLIVAASFRVNRFMEAQQRRKNGGGAQDSDTDSPGREDSS